MTLRGFSAAGSGGTRGVGGEIFSKVKTGMVNPSTLETKRPWNLPWIPPGELVLNGFVTIYVMKHSNPSNAGAAIQSQ
jgi:hypothetical protein